MTFKHIKVVGAATLVDEDRGVEIRLGIWMPGRGGAGMEIKTSQYEVRVFYSRKAARHGDMTWDHHYSIKEIFSKDASPKDKAEIENLITEVLIFYGHYGKPHETREVTVTFEDVTWRGTLV